VQLFLAEAYFQISLNMLFGPLLAVMADEVPNERKGTVAGLMGTAHPFASLSGIVFTLPEIGNEARQFALIGLATTIMILPFLIWGRESGAGMAAREQAERPRLAQRDLILAWSARFLVQAAGTAAVTYLFYYFQGILRGDGVTQLGDQTGRIARTIAIGTFLSAPLTLAAGYVSDRIQSRKPLLGTFAVLMVGGLLGMATARDWVPAQFSYLLFIVAYSGFLMLLAAFTMQILPSPERHGRDLGIINLTNTIPAMLAPALALPMFATDMNFTALLLVVALLTAAGGTLTLLIRGQR
jgi:magnesium-transporting ATPase (P-type)